MGEMYTVPEDTTSLDIANIDRRWYVLKTKPHAESQVQSILETRQIATFLPLLKQTRRSEVLFPGYLFVRIARNSDQFVRSRSVPGVSYILNIDGSPEPINDELVEEIRRRVEKENNINPITRFSSGDRVIVRSGPFQGLDAVFERALTPRGRSLILMTLLGKTTRVQVDFRCLTIVRA